MNNTIAKLILISGLSLGLIACEPDPQEEAQKKLEAEAKEIQAKAKARHEFTQKNCKEISVLECQKLMEDAGLIKKAKDFRMKRDQ